MARYGVAWPFPHEEEIVRPKMVIFKAPSTWSTLRGWRPGAFLPETSAEMYLRQMARHAPPVVTKRADLPDLRRVAGLMDHHVPAGVPGAAHQEHQRQHGQEQQHEQPEHVIE